ncbi:MAG: ABC transporter permease subunit [Elusimicrobiaceae bacterium]
MRTGLIALKNIAFQVFREQWKNRFFQLIIIFGGLIIYAALLLGAMAVEQEERVLTDFGLGLIDFVGLAAVVFGCATAILRDIETKTIYLILSRPVPRWSYLCGKYAGIMLTVAAAIAAMGAVHCSLLLLKGFRPGGVYFACLGAAWLKTCLMGGLTVLVSLISTSLLSSVVISVVFWTLGHFLAEVRFIADHMGGVAGLLLKPFLYLVPNMAVFDMKDALSAVPPVHAGAGAVLGYCALYVSVCMAYSIWLFRKKEF